MSYSPETGLDHHGRPPATDAAKSQLAKYIASVGKPIPACLLPGASDPGTAPIAAPAPAAAAEPAITFEAVEAGPIGALYPTFMAELKAKSTSGPDASLALLTHHAAATGRGKGAEPFAAQPPQDPHVAAEQIRAHVKAAAAEGRHISLATASAELWPATGASASSGSASTDDFYAKRQAADKANADVQVQASALGARAKLYMQEAATRGRKLTSAQAIAELEALGQ